MNLNQLNQIRQDPIGTARQNGYNIPDEISGDPQAMVNHLISTGQISNQKVQWIMQMIQRLGLK